jgi:hypothetical protein
MLALRTALGARPPEVSTPLNQPRALTTLPHKQSLKLTQRFVFCPALRTSPHTVSAACERHAATVF